MPVSTKKKSSSTTAKKVAVAPSKNGKKDAPVLPKNQPTIESILGLANLRRSVSNAINMSKTSVLPLQLQPESNIPINNTPVPAPSRSSTLRSSVPAVSTLGSLNPVIPLQTSWNPSVPQNQTETTSSASGPVQTRPGTTSLTPHHDYYAMSQIPWADNVGRPAPTPQNQTETTSSASGPVQTRPGTTALTPHHDYYAMSSIPLADNVGRPAPTPQPVTIFPQPFPPYTYSSMQQASHLGSEQARIPQMQPNRSVMEESLDYIIMDTGMGSGGIDAIENWTDLEPSISQCIPPTKVNERTLSAEMDEKHSSNQSFGNMVVKTEPGSKVVKTEPGVNNAEPIYLSKVCDRVDGKSLDGLKMKAFSHGESQRTMRTCRKSRTATLTTKIKDHIRDYGSGSIGLILRDIHEWHSSDAFNTMKKEEDKIAVQAKKDEKKHRDDVKRDQQRRVLEQRKMKTLATAAKRKNSKKNPASKKQKR